MFNIDRSLNNKKAELLAYFRERASESLDEIKLSYGSTQFKERAAAINKAIVATKDNILAAVMQKALAEKWSNDAILRCCLMIAYCSYVVMIESRNDVWAYDYMAFSRRIGELWEPFCKLCFQHPLKKLTLFIPPLFSEVKQSLTDEIENYIDALGLSPDQKSQLKKYYAKVWGLVDSGEIKLESDLHFEQRREKFIIDFKSGFGSNEKGNTNRLLLVATIYKNLEARYRCLLLVRAAEDTNNHYFQTLKRSGIWEAYCGDETYGAIKKLSGFDLKAWIDSNIDWDNDLRSDTFEHLRRHHLDQYLKW
ncbi:MAG: hypothetical protein AB1757_04730 [Acidobacteriota bacterium]